jgi:peptide/nickel transport system permease protein
VNLNTSCGTTLQFPRPALSSFLSRARGLGWGGGVAVASLVLISLVAVSAPWLAPYSTTVPSGLPLVPPGTRHLLGTDQVGRDVLSRCLLGLRSTWFSALVVVTVGVVVGGIVGLLAGASGGSIDALLMRITDGFLALPGPVLAIAVASALGPTLFHTLIAVAIVWWPWYARIMRGQVRALSARPHVEAARLAGARRGRVLFRHLLPGTVRPILVTASLDIGNLILMLAALSFLGLGAPAPAPELGAMAAQGMPYLLGQWWVPVAPAAFVFLLTFVPNVSGDGLQASLSDR